MRWRRSFRAEGRIHCKGAAVCRCAASSVALLPFGRDGRGTPRGGRGGKGGEQAFHAWALGSQKVATPRALDIMCPRSALSGAHSIWGPCYIALPYTRFPPSFFFFWKKKACARRPIPLHSPSNPVHCDPRFVGPACVADSADPSLPLPSPRDSTLYWGGDISRKGRARSLRKGQPLAGDRVLLPLFCILGKGPGILWGKMGERGEGRASGWLPLIIALDHLGPRSSRSAGLTLDPPYLRFCAPLCGIGVIKKNKAYRRTGCGGGSRRRLHASLTKNINALLPPRHSSALGSFSRVLV